MSRQNRNQGRDRKTEDAKRDVSNSNERSANQQREGARNERNRSQEGEANGLDKYRLNDLYERSSI